MIPVFVTRPVDQAAALIEAVSRLGFRTVSAPCLALNIEAGPPLDLTGISAIAVTSANGVTALAARTVERDLPVYAVGAATADEARAQGFSRVEVATGDGAALAALIRSRELGSATILHASGAEIAFDLAAALSGDGIQVRRQPLYTMTPAAGLPPDAVAVLNAGLPSFVLLMSPRTASVFGALAVQREMGSLTALCMSAEIAAAAREFPYRRIAVSAHRTQDSLLDLLEAESRRV
jgi:uroporphyrinogen-III synthase